MGNHDIGWAITQLKHGYMVRRPQWGAGFSVTMTHVNVATFGNVDGPQHHSLDVLIIHMPALGRVQPFTCHHDDLLATDWELA